MNDRGGVPRLAGWAIAFGLGAVLLLSLSEPGATIEAPAAAVEAAIADLAGRAGVAPEVVVLLRSAPVTWPDGCLGVSTPGESCIQVLVNGFVVWLGVEGDAYRYHTDATGQALRFAAGPFPATEVDSAPLPPDAIPQEAHFTGELPAGGGVAIVIWNGGPIEQLAAGAPHAVSFWVTDGGGLIGYVPGAPAFVNERFQERFPAGAIPSGTPMLVALPRQ